MPPIGLPDRIAGRHFARLWTGAIAALNLTCAHPTAPGPATAAAPAPAAVATAADGALMPLPPRPKPIPTTEHAELRTLGKTIARHVERGFETLIASTAEHVRCDAERIETGAEVRIQGASDPRKPWSAWFANLHLRAGEGSGTSEEGLLVMRRPLPARSEHQIAHVYLPQSVQRHARAFPLRAARRRSARLQPARAAVLGRCLRAPRARERLGRVRDRACARALPGAGAEGRRRFAGRRAGRRAGHKKAPARAGAARPPSRRRASRTAAGDGAAARAVGAGAPDGHHDGDDVAAGDAADRPRAAGGRRRGRDGAAVGAQAAGVQAAPVGGDDRGARAPDPAGAARHRRPGGVLLRPLPHHHAPHPPARGAGRRHRAGALGRGRRRRLRSGRPLRGGARPAPGAAHQAARPRGGRRPGGRRQRSLPARGQRPTFVLSGARASPRSRRPWRARWRRSAPSTAALKSVDRRSPGRRRSPSRARTTARSAATAPPSATSSSCRTAWRRPAGDRRRSRARARAWPTSSTFATCWRATRRRRPTRWRS